VPFGFAFLPPVPRHAVHTPANTAKGRLWSKANHVGVFRGFVSAYSQNDVHGTTHRYCGASQRRQCGLLTFRMLVIGAPPNAGGPGMP